MNAAAMQTDTAQLGLVQRTQKYMDAAALKLVESSTGGANPSQPLKTAEPPPRAPPVEPVSAAPREGSSIHVIA